MESKITMKEFWNLNFEFATKLSNESERGAVLIGTSRVEDFMKDLIESILPIKTKSYFNKIINYPGPLSSFSGKIELCFAFRLIDNNLYNSLNTLRKIRNEAAHSSDSFSLLAVREQINQIAHLNNDPPELLDNLVWNHMMNWKRYNAKKSFDSVKNNDLDFEQLWKEKLETTKTKENLNNQFLLWKLFYSLTLICFSIRYINETFLKLELSDKTWVSYLEKNNNA